MAPTQQDRQVVLTEMEALQLEETRERVGEIRQRRAARELQRQTIRQSLQNQRIREQMQFEGCWHKKGGKGVQSLSQGNDSHYAVIKHQLPTGETIVICQRCTHVWEKPLPIPRAATPEMKAEYKRQWEDYQWAMNLPTDNEASGTQLFIVAA